MPKNLAHNTNPMLVRVVLVAAAEAKDSHAVVVALLVVRAAPAANENYALLGACPVGMAVLPASLRQLVAVMGARLARIRTAAKKGHVDQYLLAQETLPHTFSRTEFPLAWPSLALLSNCLCGRLQHRSYRLPLIDN